MLTEEKYYSVLLCLLICFGNIILANAETNRTDILLRGYADINDKMTSMEHLFNDCYSQYIPTDYERVNFEVIRRFHDNGLDDISYGKLDRADYVLQVISNLYYINEENLNAYLVGTKKPLAVTRYRTGDIATSGYSFISDADDTVSGEESRRNMFFVGYGHFEEVRCDVPLFQKLGCNIIQIETGPDRGIINPPADDSGDEFEVDTRTVEDDIVQVLRNAEVNNVAVCLLLSPHYFPGWLLDKYPELRNDNGFLKYNINEPLAKRVIEAYLRAVIPLVKSYKSLQSICLSNEPNYHNPGGEAYHSLWYEYLKDLYNNDIGELNATYNENFNDFTNVPVANNPATYGPAMYYDWVIFNSEQFADWHKWMADIIHSIAPDIPVHAKMRLHTTFGPGDTLLTKQGVDAELFTAFTQINGCDCSAYYKADEDMQPDYLNEMSVYDIAASFHHAPVFNSEDHIINDGDRDDYNSLRADHVRNIIWQGAIHRRSASTIWLWERGSYELFQYRPDCVEAVGKTSLDLNRLYKQISAFQNKMPEVAVLYSNPAFVHSLTNYTASLKMVYRALSLSGVDVGFVSEKQVQAGGLSQYKLIFVPQTESLYADTVESLSSYAATTGNVIIVTKDMSNTMVSDEHKIPLIPSVQQARDNLIANSKIINPDSYEDFKTNINIHLREYGLNSAIVLENPETGEMIDGIEWRAVRFGKKVLVNMANYTKQFKTVRVLYNGHNVYRTKDLITDKSLKNNVITMPPLSPLLIECGINAKSSIPLLKNSTTGKIVCDDNFENAGEVVSDTWTSGDTRDADPDNPAVGSWAITEDYSNVWQVIDRYSPATVDGGNYLRGHRVSAYPKAIITGPRQTNGTMHLELMTYQFATNKDSAGIFIIDNAYEKLITSISFAADGYIIYYDGAYHSIGIQYAEKQWKKLEMDWVIGASRYSVTYDGQKAENIPVRDNATGCDGIQLGCSIGADSYFDAVPDYTIEGIPMLKNITTDTVIVHDDFELATDISTNAWSPADTQDADPDRSYVGAWLVAANTNNAQVTSYAVPGTVQGTNYFRMNRISGIYPQVFLSGVSQKTGTVHMAVMVYSADEDAASVSLVNRTGITADDKNIIANIIIGHNGDGMVNYYYSGNYHSTGIQYIENKWQELEIDWVVGSSTYNIIYNGRTATAIPVRESAVQCNGIMLGCSLGRQCYFDAVPLPEKGMLMFIK